MHTAGRIARVAALLGLCGFVDRAPAADACSVAYEAARAGTARWEPVEAACEGVPRLWALAYLGDKDELWRAAPPLYDSRDGADALYLNGRSLAEWRRDDPEGERLLGRALGRYLAKGDRRGVSRASCDLARAATARSQFDEALAWSELCVRVLAPTDHQRRRNALLALADARDLAGLGALALEALFDAEDAAGSPADRGWAYLKHGAIMLDRHTERDAAGALEFLDRARATGPDATLAIAIELNRAVALAALDRDGAAAAALAAAVQLDPESVARPMYGHVRGVLAAHRGDTALAEQLLHDAIAAEVPPDYAIEAHLLLARIYRRTQRDADAERMLAAAIAIVEALRSGGGLELRPWILAHRTTPYHELVQLRVDAGRHADALATMAALHARSWLDRDAGAAAAPTAAALLALAGDREVLVLVEAGATLWRAHVRDGAVAVDAIADGAALLEALERAPDDRAAATRAGEALIPAAVVASDRVLTIVAAGRLATVRFAALRRGDRTLVDDRPIARLPGLAAMQCPRRVADGAAVVIGDAVGDLPAARAEARALATRLGVEPRVGADATTAAVIAARDARLLHVAVHGSSSRAGGAIELVDGRLDATAIRAHAIAPREVVLAGCHTGTSPDAETWGGLPSAFLAAGSAVVLATTRSIDDADAAAMMRGFHDQRGADPFRRLAAAQRASTLPASAWASFAAWGVADCE